MAEKRPMTEAQKAALEKARAASAAKRKQVSTPDTGSQQWVGLVDEVRELKALMEQQFKITHDTFDEIKVAIDDIKKSLPKRLDTSYLEK